MVAATVTVLFCALVSEQTTSSAKVVVEVVPASHEVRSGKPVLVDVRVSSAGGEVVVPRTMIPPSHYLGFEVTSESGKRLKFIGDLVHLHLDPNDTMIVRPGLHLQRSFDLADSFHMKEPGSYQVVAIYGRPPLRGELTIGPVRSSTVTIRILPQEK